MQLYMVLIYSNKQNLLVFSFLKRQRFPFIIANNPMVLFYAFVVVLDIKVGLVFILPPPHPPPPKKAGFIKVLDALRPSVIPPLCLLLYISVPHLYHLLYVCLRFLSFSSFLFYDFVFVLNLEHFIFYTHRVPI